VSIYGFFQLVSVVLLLNYLQGPELSWWQGVAGWGILLATTANTALWLEGRPASRLLKWDLLRLGGIVLLLVLSLNSELSDGRLVWASIYGALNLLLLLLIVREPSPRDAAPVTP